MEKTKRYKIIFNDTNENNSKVIFAISKVVNCLERLYQNKKNIIITFSYINYNDDENNQASQKKGEIILQVTMSSDLSSENFKNKLNVIIGEIKNCYKINEILVKEID